MSTEELDKYKMMHNTLVERIVHLHNRNIHFTHWPESVAAGIEIRGVIKEIQTIARALKQQTKLVHIEGKKNFQENKRTLRETRKENRSHAKRKKLNDNN
jgi:hypothetical protein